MLFVQVIEDLLVFEIKVKPAQLPLQVQCALFQPSLGTSEKSDDPCTDQVADSIYKMPQRGQAFSRSGSGCFFFFAFFVSSIVKFLLIRITVPPFFQNQDQDTIPFCEGLSLFLTDNLQFYNILTYYKLFCVQIQGLLQD